MAPAYMAERARRYETHIREVAGVPEAVRNTVAEHGDLVRGGTLSGMRYPLDLLLEAHMPLAKLAGTYEKELDPHITESLQGLKERPLFLDLGCSDGYYAAGIGRLGARVVAFDIAPSARRATDALCRANGVDCETRKAASADALRELGSEAGLILSDIEGAEGAVFSRSAVAALSQTRLIIETHEPLNPGVDQLLQGRFTDSHEITIVELVEDADWVPGLSEARPAGIRWLVLEPRA